MNSKIGPSNQAINKLGNSKNKVDKLNVNKLVPIPVDLIKLNDFVKKCCC